LPISNLAGYIAGPHGESIMKTFLFDETGLELSEYAVAAALVAIAVAAAFTALGDAIGVRLNQLATRVAG
jgi:Flp pilus assembly pilin Flp